MKNYKAEIEKIVDGIGSPWGEGATYSGKSDAGKEACHLDDDERELMIKDIGNLIREIVKEALPNEMPKSANDGGIFEQEKRGFINGFNHARSEILSNIEKVIK